MNEVLNDTYPRAQQFQDLHIYLPTDFETYRHEMVTQWVEDTEAASEAEGAIRPMWLRRTDKMGSEFGAHIDYLMPMANEVSYFAAIDIDGTSGHLEIQVWLPKEDHSGEPVVASSEEYSLAALERAIELVESTVQSGE